VVQPRKIQLGRIFRAGLLVAVSVASASDQAPAQLETRIATKVPKIGISVASGDFNRDGKPDIAVTTGSFSVSFSVLLGRGDGTFQKPVDYSYSEMGTPIAAADFRGNGELDLVIGNPLGGPSNGVSLFQGNGDGTFQPPLVSPTTGLPTFIAVGDFNNDHKPDVVIIDDPGYVSVLLGNGDGTFQSPIDNNSFPGPHWVAVGDFNNDHRLDVAVVGFLGGSMNLGIMLGNGDGTLQPALLYPLNYTPGSVAVGDFNHDGNLDIVISNAGGVAVFLGDGDGGFQPGADYATPDAGGELVVEDFNGDGKLDLVLAGVGVLLGNGDGTFGPVQVFPAGGYALVVGDFNGDRKPDVVTVDSVLGGAITLLNTGVVNFSPSSPMSFPSQLINTTSGPQTVKLTNTGTATLSISSIKTSGRFQSTSTCGNSVAAGASCSISATFSPLKPDQQTGLITIVDSASSKPQVIEMTGLGTAVKLSPPLLDFGSQKVNTTSPPQQINVTNEGSATLTFNRIAIGGKDFKDFSLVSETCSPSLAAGASCVATVTFTPTKTGARAANFNIVVHGSGSPRPVVLTGTGTSMSK
jgi:FG-GAP-like repeat/Protein of unknown function (DUF1573)